MPTRSAAVCVVLVFLTVAWPGFGSAQAEDSLRLCAIRFGQCTCRAPEDGPGQWSIYPQSRCSVGVKPSAATAPTAPPLPKAASAPVPASPPPPPVHTTAGAEPAPKRSAPAQPPANVVSPPTKGLGDCALRDGTCTCKAPADGPGEWTVVDGSRCKLALLSNLSSAPATALPTSKPVVRDVQQLLRNLGYDSGPMNGVMTLGVSSAIKNFQEGTGMPMDGRITDLLVARLRQLQPLPATAAGPANASRPASASVPSIAIPTAATVSAAPGSAAPASAADGMRLCAVRFGQCTCRGPDDGPGVWTPVEPARCKPAE